MVNVPIHTGAVDGIMTFIGTPKRFNAKAKVTANKEEKIKLISRNFTLFPFLIGNACGGM